MGIHVKLSALVLGLFVISGLARAEGEDVCAPFKDGLVDEELLSVMLSAAQDGHLYRIEQSSSRVGFCVDSKLKRIEGNFRDFRGGITLDPGTSSNGQTLMMIRTDSLDTEGAMVRSLLLGEAFFDAQRHPEILFVSHSFRWTGKNKAVLKGDLTLRGITRPITFNVTLTEQDKQHAGKLLVKATTQINREEFGMDTLTALAGSKVQLCINAEARKYEPISARGAN
jgi:polyisoprenoid-binding protein YceI